MTMFDKKKKSKGADLREQVEKLVNDAKERGEGAGQNFTTLEVNFGPDEHRNGYELAAQVEKVAKEIFADFNSQGPDVCADCF